MPDRAITDGNGARRPAAAAALLGAAALLALAAWKILSWPDVARLVRENPQTTAFVERWGSRERAAGRPGRADRRWVPYEAISAHLKRAVLVSEDINFFSHEGFEVAEIKAALQEAIDDRDLPRGASTITQQLAKNLWLSPSRNPLRKLEEALLTRQLERTLSKKRILELYLNVVEFGPGVWGAEAASSRGVGEADIGSDGALYLAKADNTGIWVIAPGAPARSADLGGLLVQNIQAICRDDRGKLYFSGSFRDPAEAAVVQGTVVNAAWQQSHGTAARGALPISSGTGRRLAAVPER